MSVGRSKKKDELWSQYTLAPIPYARGVFGALTVVGFFYFIMLYIEWIAGNGRAQMLSPSQ